MTTIAEIEALVVARLRTALTLDGQAHPVVDVEPWPDDPVAYRMMHPCGAVLVMYQGAKYDEEATARQVVNSESLFELALLSKTLRAPVVQAEPGEPDTGVYTLLETCRKALFGWQPDGAANITRVLKEAYEGYREGVWSYSLSMALPRITIVDREPAPGVYDFPGEPLVKTINYQEQL